MNTISIIGRLCKDVDLRTTQNNVVVASFTVAVDRRYKDANGNKQADFLPCVAFKQTAELIGKYFQKGSQIGVVGSVQTRNYSDKDGKKVYVTEIIVDNISFCGSNQNGQAPQKNTQQTIDLDDSEDNLPFDL